MKLLKYLFIVLLLAQAASAQKIAKYAGEFISIGVGGRALGLGGAYAALANDASAGYWNPAGLSRIEYPEIMVMHDERFGNLMNYDFGAVALPFGTDATLGLSVMRLSIDDIMDTRLAGVDANGNPITQEQLDQFARIDSSKISYFNAADWALYASYAKRVSDDFSYGINVKILRRNLSVASATGIGFDIGALYSPLEDWFVAANIQDVTTTLIAWSTGTNELISPTLKLGTVYFFDFLSGRFAPTIDVDVRFENRRYASIAHLGPISLDPHYGLEFDFKKTIALRVGYSDVRQLTLGAGIHLRKLDIDYSFARFSGEDDLGNTHRISLKLILQEEKFARTKSE
jgi:hypothetical protein